METKAITPSFTERGEIVCPAATLNSKLQTIESLFKECDYMLASVGMSDSGYTSQGDEINRMTENMRNLSLYASTAHDRVSEYLDKPLYEHFKKNATETITAINLNELTTENTFGLAEYVEIKRQGKYFVNKSVKKSLTMKDFLGLQEITAEDGTAILENAETMWEFASLFRLEYDKMTEKTVDLDSFLNWYLDTGDAEHKGYHPVADMISGILDITIVKPVLECELGKDYITGEYLTEYDIRWKQAGIIIDLVTLGGGSKLIDGVKTLEDFLKASGKTLTVDALAATATYGTAYIGEEIGLSEEAILVLSTLAGVGTSYVAGKAIIKDAKVVIEGGLDASIKNIDEFIGGNKAFDDVLDDYAKVYADKINSNQAWSWDDTIPGGENLTKKQRSIIKQQAIDAGLIPDIKVTKVDGMRYGFADFESAGVVKETQYLPENMWKMSDAEQFKWLDEQIGGTVEGYTWHHTEIPGKMQLVPTGIHNITTHNGGRTAGMWADAPR